MRLALLIPGIVLATGTAWPLSDLPELAASWAESRYLFPPVDDLPDSLVPAGVSELCIGGLPEGVDSLTLFLVGEGPEGPVVVASGPYSGEFNFTKSSASWEADRSLIAIYFQMPFSARYAGADYSWRGEVLMPVTFFSGDPSLEALDRIDSLLAAGRIRDAGIELDGIFYPGNYIQDSEMCAVFLRSAHTFGLEEYRRGNPEGAVLLFMDAEAAMEYLFIETPWFSSFRDPESFMLSDMAACMALEEYVTIMNDYGFFLEQADRYADAVQVLQSVLDIAPDRMVAHLNMADALWGSERYSEAATHYVRYSDMMEEAGLEEQIPPRVNERILSTGTSGEGT